MDEEDLETIITVEPMLHDRWSLLLFTVSAAAEMAAVVANNLATASLLIAQHVKQKKYDKKFKEITK